MQTIYINLLMMKSTVHIQAVESTKQTALDMYYKNSLIMLGLFALILIISLFVLYLGKKKGNS